MKQYSKKLFSIAMLLSTAAATANVSPYLQFRSQGRNTARKIVGETSFATDLYDMESWYGTFDATLEYDRSFRPQNITNALFGADAVKLSTATTNNNGSSNGSGSHGRSIVVSGSQLATRTAATDWMAENFLLPRNFQSIMSFKPLVQNILVNFDWYMGLDNWAKGLYFRLYGPVVNNRTSLRFNENVISKGSTGYASGFFTDTNVTVEQLFTSAGQFFSGQQLEKPIPTDTSGVNVTFNPLQFAKFNIDGHKSKTGFAELRGELGWNYLQEKYRVGFNIQAAAPTGTRPKAEWMLEPEIGNGKHWELGVGLKGLWTMWRSEDEEKHFDFVVEADITHLFKAKQTRTFDLIGKPNSRYMLAEKLAAIDATVFPHLDTATDPEQVQFANEYSPVANFSTRKVNVSIGVQGDVVAMFTYAVRGFTWDIGYNFWGMSHEKISFSSSSNSSSASDNSLPFPDKTWALKGDASVAGGIAGSTATVWLAATETGASNNNGGATIHVGTNGAATDNNPNVDNAVAATATPSAGATSVPVLVEPGATPPVAINTSNPPVFISAAMLDLNGAAVRGYSNKVFTHFGYTWSEREKWIPYVGAGVSAEFGSHSGNDNSTTSSVRVNNSSSGSSNSFGLSQWAIWLKGGVSFH